jgi:hypothetical protein
MTGDPNPLGDYLRARRELVTPERAGIGSFGPRRVPGLRREEVAMLAGISADYYLGTDTDDPRFIELVGELSLASDQFRQLWARHDVRARTGAAVTLAHPQVGELTLDREKLEIGGTDGQLLAIYHAEPGTTHADKLSLLASYSSRTPQPVRAQTGQAQTGEVSSDKRSHR